MKCLIIACTFVVSAVTGVLANPINTERDIFCPPGDTDCGYGPVCSIHDCGVCPHFPGCGTEVERHAQLSKRQIECPPGSHCGTEPVCTIHDCDLCSDFPGCGTEVERDALLSKRHSECPPSSHCGHGPVCSIHDCDLCPEFLGCGTEVEGRAMFLAKRQLECPAGLDCDFAPDCTIYDCDKYPSLHGCGGEVELRSLEVERDAQTTIPEHPCALVCNKDRCLYVPEREKEKRNPQDDLWCFANRNDQDVCMIPYVAKKEKCAPKTDLILPCPFICDQQGGCLCTEEDIIDTAEKEKRDAETDLILPCPFICNQQGECVCTHENEKRTIGTDIFLPYPFDCNEHGTCTCHDFDGNRKCCIAPQTNTNDCIITQRDSKSIQKRNTVFIHACPLIYDDNYHYACAADLLPVDETAKRNTDYRGPPCPSGNLICMNTGCKCGGSFTVTIDGPPTIEKRNEDFGGPPCPTGSIHCTTSGCRCTGPPRVPLHGPPTET